MYRSEDEQQVDTKFGEAVLSLISEGVPVNETTLIQKLQQMLIKENDAAGREATFCAIREAEVALSMQKQQMTTGGVLSSGNISAPADATQSGTGFKH